MSTITKADKVLLADIFDDIMYHTEVIARAETNNERSGARIKKAALCARLAREFDIVVQYHTHQLAIHAGHVPTTSGIATKESYLIE